MVATQAGADLIYAARSQAPKPVAAPHHPAVPARHRRLARASLGTQVPALMRRLLGVAPELFAHSRQHPVREVSLPA